MNFFEGDLNKFVLLLREGVYPWGKFEETSLPHKRDFKIY